MKQKERLVFCGFFYLIAMLAVMIHIISQLDKAKHVSKGLIITSIIIIIISFIIGVICLFKGFEKARSVLIIILSFNFLYSIFIQYASTNPIIIFGLNSIGALIILFILGFIYLVVIFPADWKTIQYLLKNRLSQIN